MRHHRHSYARARGFTLLEALVALLVLSFGMLAIAGFQVTLSRSADLAKQRTEATRLAQKQVEKLRSFVQVGTDTVHPPTHLLHKVNYTDDVVNGTAATIANNATFNLTWTVTANAADTEKSVNVLVTWDDRAGQSQSVQLLSVIAKFDPQSIGTLATGPGGTGVRHPRNRNFSGPLPAIGLSGGLTSAFVPPPGNVVFIFNNASGDVTHKCTGGLIPTEGQDLINTTGANCTGIDAYLLSGLIFFRGLGIQIDASDIENQINLPSISEEFDSTNPLILTPLSGTLPQECFVLTTVANRYIPYICVVEPVDHDTNPVTRKRWSGELTLNPSTTGPGAFQIGLNSNERRVCRFTSDYNRNGSLSNREHPRFYRDVTGALSSQNFLVTRGTNHCPADMPSDLVANFVDTNTADHQPTAIAEFSFRCTTLNANGFDCASKVFVEFTNTTTLPMN